MSTEAKDFPLSASFSAFDMWCMARFGARNLMCGPPVQLSNPLVSSKQIMVVSSVTRGVSPWLYSRPFAKRRTPGLKAVSEPMKILLIIEFL